MPLSHKATVLATAALFIPAWVVAIAGLGAITHECNQEQESGLDCARGLQYQWWGLFFELILVVAIYIIAMKDGIAASHSSINAFLAICTSVLMLTARDFMSSNNAFLMTYSAKRSAMNAGSAGFVMLCILNFILILLVGAAPSIPHTVEQPTPDYGKFKDTHTLPPIAPAMRQSVV